MERYEYYSSVYEYGGTLYILYPLWPERSHAYWYDPLDQLNLLRLAGFGTVSLTLLFSFYYWSGPLAIRHLVE